AATAHEVAAAYGLGYVIRQEPGPDRAVGGTTSTAAAEIGIPAIIAEAGGCGLIEPAAVNAHIRGLGRVLALLGMADDPAGGEGRAGPPTYLRRFLWLRSTCEG
ncbi:MAG TPA: succinylglutamate desuccinylase/aspartoacylase family protein, partial [Streptosporangiaceae bacterium]|nr:succinylglutamate desuccinylase/aspartoacylase family protein [Streptosporangiaceae bacterium]